MAEDNFLKYIMRFVFIWSLGSLISYGHILKEYKSENDYSAYSDAWFAATFAWPYHWSGFVWSKI